MSSSQYSQFLQEAMKTFLKILQEGEPQFIAEHNSQVSTSFVCKTCLKNCPITKCTFIFHQLSSQTFFFFSYIAFPIMYGRRYHCFSSYSMSFCPYPRPILVQNFSYPVGMRLSIELTNTNILIYMLKINFSHA